jgi:N-acetylneuraminate synthase
LRDFAVRAIQATRDIAAGEELVEGRNIALLRPGKRSKGLHPRHLDSLRGRTAARDIGAGDGIGPDDVAPPVS